jgi:hypothetical protein
LDKLGGSVGQLTIEPVLGLDEGVHTAQVTVGKMSIEVIFEVVNDYKLELSQSKDEVLDFGIVEYSYLQQDPATITVRNSGTKVSDTLSIVLLGTNKDDFSLSTETLPELDVNAEATFTVVPNNGLAVGGYNATVAVSGPVGHRAQIFNVRFSVSSGYIVTLSPSINFNDDKSIYYSDGYDVPPARSVDIHNEGIGNTGALSITLSSGDTEAFTLGGIPINNIEYGKSTSFTIQPKAWRYLMEAKTYEATVTVTLSEHTYSESITVSFTVTESTWSIELDQTGSVTMDEKPFAYTTASSLPVKITNRGNRPTDGLTVALGGANPNAFSLTSATEGGASKAIVSIGKDGYANFTVYARLGQSVGKYNATVTVSGAHGITATFNLSFEVKIVVVNILTLDTKVTAPVVVEVPKTTAIDTIQYTGKVEWKTETNGAFSGGIFAPSTVYKALVTLSVKAGYTFTGVLANSFTYTGASVSNSVNSGTVTITFSKTGKGYTLGSNTTTQDLKVKFGTSSVSDTFKALHNYINDPDKFTATSTSGSGNNVVRNGDYIDLPSLKVDAYADPNPESASTNATGADGAFNITSNTSVGSGKLLRLIVVGVNSFNRRTTKDDAVIPHVVFQFQNVPVLRRMDNKTWLSPKESYMTYKNTEMPTYLTGNFRNGLEAAGVPVTFLWAPTRKVYNGDWASTNSNSTTNVTDVLWLPTEREMFNTYMYSKYQAETSENQAHLEYYGTNDNNSRIKYNASNAATIYWGASGTSDEQYITGVSATGTQWRASYPSSNTTKLTSSLGIAPAFCVK